MALLTMALLTMKVALFRLRAECGAVLKLDTGDMLVVADLTPPNPNPNPNPSPNPNPNPNPSRNPNPHPHPHPHLSPFTLTLTSHLSP